MFKILKRVSIDNTEMRLPFKLNWKGIAVIRLGKIEKEACIRKELR